jgi:hypothetical protein
MDAPRVHPQCHARGMDDVAAMINARLGGWNTRMGLRFTRVSADECVGELVVGDDHLQP